MHNNYYTHVCRVYHLAGEFAKHLQEQMKIDKCAGAGEEELWKFTEQEVLCAEIAGLCHDLGTMSMMHNKTCTKLTMSLSQDMDHYHTCLNVTYWIN